MGRLGITPRLTSKELSSQEGLLDFKENKKYTAFYLLSGQGPASFLNCPAINTVEFLTHGLLCKQEHLSAKMDSRVKDSG